MDICVSFIIYLENAENVQPRIIIIDTPKVAALDRFPETAQL
jgi:hypothetical protein